MCLIIKSTNPSGLLLFILSHAQMSLNFEKEIDPDLLREQRQRKVFPFKFGTYHLLLPCRKWRGNATDREVIHCIHRISQCIKSKEQQWYNKFRCYELINVGWALQHNSCSKLQKLDKRYIMQWIESNFPLH